MKVVHESSIIHSLALYLFVFLLIGFERSVYPFECERERELVLE